MSQSSASLINYQIGANSYAPLQSLLAQISGRNYIVDGNFDSIISGSVAVAAGGSSNNVATMYYGIAGATNGGTLSATWTLGYDPAGMNSPVANALTWTQSSAPTSSPSITQRIENVQTLQGRSATFSCWLWCASGTQTITNIQVLQNFGTGGSPSSLVTVNAPVNWVLTTTPQRFSVLLNIPSVVGKTLGTNPNTHYLQVYVQYPASGTYAISTTQWQLERSSPNAPVTGTPTAFDYRGVQAELARVQRYYVAPGFGSIQCGYADVATRAIAPLAYWFPVVMRAAPTGVVSTSGGVNASVGAVSTNPYGAVLGCSGIAAGYVQYSYTLTSFDARL
ncbi:hypothetical protein [Paraburkholderia sediminicola]|uniref:hypothetical protein n=1 Tax=Paraburkholderia sediminicola TaxID=458836 RepID=UPI0038B886C2